MQKMAEKITPVKNTFNHQDIIPTTARAIKITNIQSLYVMRAYETTNYKGQVDKICRHLLNFINTDKFSKKGNNAEPVKINDVVLVRSNNLETGVAILPSFLCRGLITLIKENDKKYNVLLVDYGVSIELTRDEFEIVPKDFIPEKYLTQVIGLYNVLPIQIDKNTTSNKSKAIIVEEWSIDAIQFTKDLLIASEVVYYDYMATDRETGREYGEFYLVIDDMVISLSAALIINYYATLLDGDLLQSIESPNNAQWVENTEKDVVIQRKFSSNSKKNATSFSNETNKHNSVANSEKVFIESKVKCEVLTDVSDLGFPKGVHRNWTKYISSSRPRKIQSHMWPPIKKGLNVVAIGSLQCGKTTGCTMAVCGLVAMRQIELSRNGIRNPLAIILCSSSFEVMSVHSLCLQFLESFNNIKCVAAFNGKSHRSIAALIYGGCQILISTPLYLVRFLDENRNILSFDKLSYLVLDDADIILKKYYTTIGKLFHKHKIIENREPQGDNRPILQIILSARNCTYQIKKFVSLAMYNPYICITSFIEAVVFKSVHPKVFIMKSTFKNKKISEFLNDDYSMCRIMVVCTNANEAEKLNTFLQKKEKSTMLIHEKMTLVDIQTLRESWRISIHGAYPVLICTDVVLSQLNITNIEWLIHYSIQMQFKNQFNYRFSVLLDNLVQGLRRCKISILVDEMNDIQLQSIIKIMQRMDIPINSDLLESVERIAVTLEREKKNFDICDNVKSLGFCSEQNACVFRHCVLPEIDKPLMNIEINDKIKLLMMYIHDATHFSARVIEHIPHSKNSSKLIFSNVEYMQITAKMQEYYQNVENRKMSIATNVGDICVYEESLDIFKRVQIQRIRYDKDISEDVKYVDVRCIDSGVIHESINVRKLLHIPKELLNYPTHIVEIFLANIAPCDDEYKWNYCSNEAVHKWFSNNFDGNSYIIGKVRLHLEHTIWLDDLQIGTKLINHNDIIGCSLKKELIMENYAVQNDDHIPRLLQLCKTSRLFQINGYDISATNGESPDIKN